MNLQKTHILITAFLLFWIVFIGWGMLKTGAKLSKEKAAVPTVTQKQTQPEAAPKKEITPLEKAAEKDIPPNPPAETGPIPVRVFEVRSADFQDTLPVMGTVKGKTEIGLKFEVNGVIEKIYFREGEKIKKGGLIASLDPKDAQLRLAYAKNKFNAAEAAYNSIQKKLEVQKKLYEAGAIIKSKLEEVTLECKSAGFQLETTKSETELAENELNKTLLYANTDGVMGPREKEEGEFVTPQDKIGSLLEISEVFVEVGVVERDINKIKLGQKAKVYVDANPDVTFEGRVDSIFPVVEGKSRTLTAKIKVPNPNGLLFPGMFSRAEILIIELKNALIIPVTSLIPSEKGKTLLPVIPQESTTRPEDGSQTGIVELRRVNTGYMTSDYVQVTKGLKSGDFVVMETRGELKDNAAVRIEGIEESAF
ncbi:MAG: efflux RND transporter periplasmic adaptor subunit [Candidatus Omnitrophica bacterium]|nr:efflux RND transporter periplasmic adaptor subunit [Candidatus Omnitrophota bacterium]MDD5592067.1 efflux RND transporter periplasmic adaptor subunit [Candidatus Omnitrophota bacterium]